MSETTPPAGMRWREYKGVRYQDGRWRYKAADYATAVDVIAVRSAVEPWTDDDHAPLMALKDKPLEPVPVERDDAWQQVRDLAEDVFDAGWAQHAGKQTRDYPGLDAIADRIVALFDAGVPAAVLTCHKVPHFGNGWLHDESDDSPYDVDGVLYCGRCHHRCGADGKCARATPEVQAVEVLVKAGWTTRLVRKVGSTSWHADENDNATKRVARYHDGEPYGYPVHRALIAPTREGA